MIQTKKELEDFYKKKDPWGYEGNAADKDRKAILLGELARIKKPKQVLDIGCGHGFITRELPGDKIIGLDISTKAIAQAKKLSNKPNYEYIAGDIFDLTLKSVGTEEPFDLIIITGVLYPQYVGSTHTVVYEIVDKLLARGGHLVSVHIDEWYMARFPYIMSKQLIYNYREYQHNLEIYKKI